MNRLYVIALAAIGLMSMLAAFLGPGVPDEPVAAVPAAGKTASDPSVLVLTRNGSGQFTLPALVNGSDMTFLVDTGADLVALTEADADALGVMPDEDAFQPVLQTASGFGYGAPVVLSEVEVVGHTFSDVEAVVVKDLGTNLLGQSLLRRLGSVELQGDKMVIRAR
ncbi:MAG: TIGR02281 family clan AA aspartic protease [Novosphingobium sp.]